MMRKQILLLTLIVIVLMPLTSSALAGDGVAVSSSIDFFSRYVWRGLDIANTPSLQPSLSVGASGLEFGAWGAYALSNEAFDADEIDFWLSYTGEMKSGVSVTGLVTDYYFPNAGIDFFNFNNYDAVKNDTIPDPGAHTFELGLSVTGPSSFPVTLSGYVNIYNDAGSNTYFQLDYPVAAKETELNFFCGVAGGSKDNPGYYGADDVSVINLGVNAVRAIKVSESFTIPLSVSLIVNPKAEITHLVAGMSF